MQLKEQAIKLGRVVLVSHMALARKLFFVEIGSSTFVQYPLEAPVFNLRHKSPISSVMA